MSLLVKQFTPTPQRRSHRRLYITLSIVAILVVFLLLFTNTGNDTAFVAHFVTPPQHFTYSGHSNYVNSVAWSPDGKRIASGGADATVQVWDALTGSHEYTYRGHLDFYWGHFTSDQEVDTVAWSPDGQQIASGGTDNTVQVWQPQ